MCGGMASAHMDAVPFVVHVLSIGTNNYLQQKCCQNDVFVFHFRIVFMSVFDEFSGRYSLFLVIDGVCV